MVPVAVGVGVEWKLAFTVSAVREVKLLYKGQLERENRIDAAVDVGHGRDAGWSGTAERRWIVHVRQPPLLWEVGVVR